MLSGISLIKLVVVLGLAIWSLLESWGLIRDFTGAKKMVGRIMNMESIEMPPIIPTKLLSRRITREWCHWAGAVILIAFNLISSFLLFISVYYFFDTNIIDEFISNRFLTWANYGVSVFIGMGFLLSFVGIWFAYYIKQSDLMLIHFTLIILGVVSAIVINLNTIN
ncbi:DUF2165 family protein [Xenorhabdus sp. SF857]|uniref:DUF2165 family protein n=1 Tax=Xenorhabdus bakwenae TaxID=3026967 RepID=UPI002557EF58|nr:DUF2165 family protein [Xenorhabdus sp. SF857]WFQ79988.1 DUF2165 family protein [Xenorhabdus sp. SF857]